MIYLNNTATSFPKPKEVLDTISNLNSLPPCNHARSGLERESEDLIYNTREKLSKFFNCDDPNNIIFTSGSTEALNLAIKGIDLKGAHVVSTAIEHNSVIRPLKTLEAEGTIEATFVECDSETYVSPEAIEKAIKNNTKLVVVNHSSNVTGTTLDLKEIAKIAHKHNCLFLVDASQSAGNLPLDVLDMELDLMAFTGHKSLYGLPGIGGLYIRTGLELNPLKVGGTGVLSEILVQPPGKPIYYEAGTPNMPGIASLNSGMDFINRVGVDTIREHKVKQVKRIIAELENFKGLSVYWNKKHNSFANFCFNIEGFVPEEVGYMLESSYDIHVRSGLHCAPLLLEALGVHPWGTVRASPSYFTTDDEISQFINAVKEISSIKNK